MALQENPTLLHTVIELLVRSCWKWAFIGKSGWRPRLPLAPISQAGRFSCSPKFVFDTQHIHRTPNQHVKIPDRPWTSNMISRIGRGFCSTNFVLQELEKKVKFQLSTFSEYASGLEHVHFLNRDTVFYRIRKQNLWGTSVFLFKWIQFCERGLGNAGPDVFILIRRVWWENLCKSTSYK